MNADAKETLPWDEQHSSNSPLGDDDTTERVPLVAVPRLGTDEPHRAPQYDEPSIVVCPDIERPALETRRARAFRALTEEPERLPSVLHRMGGAVAAPFGYAGAAGERLWMTLASPAFRSDIERLTSSVERADAAAIAEHAQTQLGRALQGAAALLLPTLAAVAMVLLISLPRLSINDAHAGSSSAYELTPLVQEPTDGWQADEPAPPALRGEWPAALQVKLPAAQDHGPHGR